MNRESQNPFESPSATPAPRIQPVAPQKQSFLNQVQKLFRGQVLFAFSQWAILAMLVKFGGDIEAGKYTLAMITTAPIFLFFDLNLRVSRSTDHQYDEQFRSYLGLRMWCLLLATITAICIVFSVFGVNLAVFFGLIAFRIGESITNLSFGGYQRMEFSDQIGTSLTRKGLTAMVVMAAVIPLADGNAGAAAIAMAAISISWALLVDLPRSWRLNEPDYSLTLSSTFASLADVKSAVRIAKRSLPLGFDALVSSLAINTPKYCVEYWFGTAVLGVFGVLSQLAFSIQMLIGAVGHAGVAVLSSLFRKPDRTPFWRLLNRMILASFAVGVVAIIGGTIVVPPTMTWLLGPTYNKTFLFFLLLLASCFAGVQRTAGRATQACGSYFIYTLFDIVIFSTTAVSALWLVKEHGVIGAAVSMSIGFAVGLLITLVHTYGFLSRSNIEKLSDKETIAQQT